MTLDDFEDEIEQKIVDRGRAYFKSGHVESIEQAEPQEFIAEVLGSEEYNVRIRLSQELGIIDHDCDCPYDWGPFCKHQVAVLYYIREKKIYKKLSEKAGRFAVLKQNLADADRAPLERLILDLAKTNRAFREKLEDYFREDNTDYI